VIYIILNYFDVYSGYAGVLTTVYQLGVSFVAGIAVFGGLGYSLGIFRRRA